MEALQIRVNFILTQLLISSNVQERKLQQVDLWFPEVKFIPTDCSSNTVTSSIKSQVCNTIIQKALQAIQQEVQNLASEATVLY